MGSKLHQTKVGQMTRDLLLQVLLRLCQDRFNRYHSICHWFIFSVLLSWSSWMTGSTLSQSEVRQMNHYCLAGMCFPALRARYTHFEFWFVHTIANWCLWLIRVISLNNSNTSQLAVIWHACFMLVTAHVNCITKSQMAHNCPDLS